MKLVHYQIEHIENFVKSQRVHYSDIQNELTDHIASAVEQKMEADHISFGEAFSESIKDINCFKIQRQKLMSETFSHWKSILFRAFNLQKGDQLALFLTIGLLITALHLGIADAGRLDNWLSVVLKIIIVAPAIYALVNRKQKPYRFSCFMTSVVGLYLLVEIITVTKTFVLDNLFTITPWGQSIYFSLAFVVSLTGYRMLFKSYQQVKRQALH